MNDDELDLWLTIHTERFDQRIKAEVRVELRRQRVQSAAASAPRASEPDLAEFHAIWSERADPTDPRSRRGRSVRGRVRRSATRPASTHPAEGSFTRLGPRVAVARYRPRSADATHTVAVILVVLGMLVASAVVGDFANQRSTAPPPDGRGKDVVIGVPTNVWGLGMTHETHRYGFAFDLANWLADDLHYSPRTLYSFSDIDGFPDDHMEMFRRGDVDMMIAPNAVADRRGTEVSFAGPILLTQGAVLVRADSTAIRTIDDLDGKRVCTWTESTYKDQSTRLGDSVPVEEDVLSSCVDALLAGGVDAVAGDLLVLSEIAEVEEAEELSVVPGLSFGGQQRYGVVLEHDDISECEEVRNAIRRFIASGAWNDVFQANMPEVPPDALKPDPDHLDRCA